ncbi:uncharacterized protein SCHCODRAFT_01227964 [Schizophyllum commune H4-8]|uniref:uncharacterized protein n=1 Tax=Schizophyllum commune (strain H4-8 / FGSC 9210) TaxID=578458 RepID=UPI00215ECFE1|nr:uncharacterized protein SCHCODRAFT_01227964 [Schizophyllum commune H4-8]KAI5894353.1 hypothetical protein SCHCODRAFT_01227964 [Schizophyllum commune H4-8]
MEVELDFDHQVNMEVHVSHLQISRPTLLIILAAITSVLLLYLRRRLSLPVDKPLLGAKPPIAEADVKSQRDRTPGGSVTLEISVPLPTHHNHQNGTPYLPTYTPSPPRTSTPPPAGMFPRSPPSNTGPSNGGRNTSERLFPASNPVLQSFRHSNLLPPIYTQP